MVGTIENKNSAVPLSYLHHVDFSSLRSWCIHSNSGLPLSAVVIRVNLRRGVKMVVSIVSS